MSGKIILGVDPGSRIAGYGVIQVNGNKEEVIEYGVLKLESSKSHQVRLKQIYDRLTQVIKRCKPDEGAIEMPVYAQNPQSLLKLGRAQSAAMLALLNMQIPVVEYTPKEVKRSVTGNGNAAKEQVWYMVRSILKIDDSQPALGLDASDALAVALCHAHRVGKKGKQTYKDWSAFVKENPGRTKGQ